ncbi:hypothetical protein CENSYa_1588 [Cenarchaeum symbiosum A]|uniref:Uncharacterized protein n=1 Tax=Cenarchaeum symbiosum (strain A) TaxID=414004 RepID=A0RXZ1_CENSY|nr:hypothetical protein CENSYa_1588 [Cenarchaeum symbiosum A]
MDGNTCLRIGIPHASLGMMLVPSVQDPWSADWRLVPAGRAASGYGRDAGSINPRMGCRLAGAGRKLHHSRKMLNSCIDAYTVCRQRRQRGNE